VVQETRRVIEGAGVQVYIPYPLRELTKGAGTVELKADDLAQAIDALNRRFPGLSYRLLDDQGRLRRFVNAFVNEESVSHLPPGDVRLHAGDVITILPNIAGG
jgi:molybdopterin converting factor small subunit